MYLTTKAAFFSVVFSLMGIMIACNSDEAVRKPAMPDNPVKPPVFSERPWPADLDKSPMDMIYYPDEYPILKMSNKTSGPPVARVIYSRPAKDGRKIFGNVVKYGSYWRLGANESTEIEFFQDVRVTGKTVKRGRYIMYCIPFEDKWTIRLNNDLYTWGLRVHATGDQYSFDIPAQKSDTIFEVLTMTFSEQQEQGVLVIAWDDVKVYLPFTY